jgi:hypothetical protein
MNILKSFWQKNLRNLFIGLSVTGVLLVLTYLVFQGIRVYYPFFENRWIFQLFDVGREANAPTYFAVLLFIGIAVSAWVCGVFDKWAGKAKKEWIPWIVIAWIVAFLGFDELTQVHEQLTYHTQNLLGVSGFFHFAWVIPYGVLFFLISLYMIPFLWKLPRQTKYAILGGAVIFVSGAIGVEMIGARFYEIGGVYHPGFIIASSIEEIMEIAGQMVALWGMFGEVSRRLDNTVV